MVGVLGVVSGVIVGLDFSESIVTWNPRNSTSSRQNTNLSGLNTIPFFEQRSRYLHVLWKFSLLFLPHRHTSSTHLAMSPKSLIMLL